MKKYYEQKQWKKWQENCLHESREWYSEKHSPMYLNGLSSHDSSWASTSALITSNTNVASSNNLDIVQLNVSGIVNPTTSGIAHVPIVYKPTYKKESSLEWLDRRVEEILDLAFQPLLA